MSRPPIESFVGPRARSWLIASLVASVALLAIAMGAVAPSPPRPAGASGEELRDRIVRDLQRLRAAVADYTLDTGAFPPPVFDVSEGFDGGLSDPDHAPSSVRSAWRGPYLTSPVSRLAPGCFWSLTAPRRLLDRDGDGEEDEAWARLHRGQGTIDPELAAWCDRTLDDGIPDSGVVRVTPVWIWFHLLER